MTTPMEMFHAMQAKLRESSREYETIAEELSANSIAQQQAQQQLSENEMVLKELELLEDDANVYKLIGPVLVKQDLVEARGNVEKRLGFIKAESDRLEKAAAACEKKHEEKQRAIMELQQKMMALANPSAT